MDVPILEASRWIYECEVVKSVELGESTTFFCRIRNIQIDEINKTDIIEKIGDVIYIISSAYEDALIVEKIREQIQNIE